MDLSAQRAFRDREQAVTAGAAAVVIAILVSGRAVTALANPDELIDGAVVHELIDGAFVLAERFVARAEERAAHIKKARTPQ